MSVYIDVWHRTHPLTAEAHARFLDFYGTWVVGPPSDLFEVLGGFRYLDGPSNSDFALYRYASMSRIEEAMMSFGADADYMAATQATFSELDIEETRAIAIYLPHASDERIDAIAGERPTRRRRYLRVERRFSMLTLPRAYELLGRHAAALEKATGARLVTSFSYLVGPVTDGAEIFVLPEGETELSAAPAGVDADLIAELAEVAPETQRRALEPTSFSKLQ